MSYLIVAFLMVGIAAGLAFLVAAAVVTTQAYREAGRELREEPWRESLWMHDED